MEYLRLNMSPKITKIVKPKFFQIRLPLKQPSSWVVSGQESTRALHLETNLPKFFWLVPRLPKHGHPIFVPTNPWSNFYLIWFLVVFYFFKTSSKVTSSRFLQNKQPTNSKYTFKSISCQLPNKNSGNIETLTNSTLTRIPLQGIKFNSSTNSKNSYKITLQTNYPTSSTKFLRAKSTTMNWIQTLFTTSITFGSKLAWITKNNKITKFTTNFTWVTKLVKLSRWATQSQLTPTKSSLSTYKQSNRSHQISPCTYAHIYRVSIWMEKISSTLSLFY